MSAPVFRKGTSGTIAADATGLEAYCRALGVTSSSTDGTGSTPALFRVTASGSRNRYYLSLTNTLTIAMASSGILTSSSGGSTTLLIPTFASMGFTRDPINPVEMEFKVQRDGAGSLFVNPATGVSIIWNDLDPQYLSTSHPPVTLTTRGTDSWYAS